MSICPWCGKNFSSENSLNSHKRFCESKPERFFCDCGEGFKEKNDFYNHRKTCDKTSFLKRNFNKNWDCECGETFGTRRLLYEHREDCNFKLSKKLDSLGRIIPENDGSIYRCDWCGRTTKSKRGNTYHQKRCKKNPNRVDGNNKNIPHDVETISKIRNSTIKFIRKHKGFKTRYNPEACKFIDNLNKKNNWDMIHAENGGEFEIDGYFIDGYDTKRNIAFEYDEPRHYQDIYNNVLVEKDIKRMARIKEKLNCGFYRYNEKLDLFYKC